MFSPSQPLSLKVSGPALLLALGGAALAWSSLWMAWSYRDPGSLSGDPVAETGWAWMVYGDVLLTITCAVVAAVAVWICARPRRHAVGFGIGAVLLIVCAMLGALVVAALTTISLVDFDTVGYQRGPGPTIALAGLAVAAAGVVVAMLGAVPHDRPMVPHWHLPHHRGAHGH